MWSGRANSRGVSAIRVLAAGESRHEERTASPSHLIMRDDRTVVFESANRRLTELAVMALRTLDVAVASHPRVAHSTAAYAGPALGGGPASAAGPFEPTHAETAGEQRTKSVRLSRTIDLTATAAS